MRKVDILVLGSGISGSTAAALLAQKGYSVALLSKDAGTAHHLPESWIYNPSHGINLLGIQDKILPALQQQSRCLFCSSNNQYSIEVSIKETKNTIEEGDLVWVDRNQFDRILLDAALSQGVEFQPHSHITKCQITQERVSVCTTSQQTQEEFIASYLIDATGKTAFLSQHLQLKVEEQKLDTRVAYFSHFEFQSDIEQTMRIVHIKDGYIFCIPISDRRLSIGCVLAEDSVNTSLTIEEIFNLAVASSSYVTTLVNQSTRVLPIIPAKNRRRICLEPSGARYRLVGDAAAFLDPFFCPGIDFALFSAQQAVQTIGQGDFQDYSTAVMKWLKNSENSVYEKMHHCDWEAILRLFADPHLPFIAPLMLTQAFGQLVHRDLNFKEGIQVARRAYEVATC